MLLSSLWSVFLVRKQFIHDLQGESIQTIYRTRLFNPFQLKSLYLRFRHRFDFSWVSYKWSFISFIPGLICQGIIDRLILFVPGIVGPFDCIFFLFTIIHKVSDSCLNKSKLVNKSIFSGKKWKSILVSLSTNHPGKS